MKINRKHQTEKQRADNMERALHRLLAQVAIACADMTKEDARELSREFKRARDAHARYRNPVQLGDVITCAETGREFVAARDGITTNYALSSSGEVLSDEGVDIRERRALLDRTQPFNCYVSSDGKHVTGWKGNVLGDVETLGTVRLTRMSHTHGKFMHSYRVRDVHGNAWSGRGSPGVCITLHPIN